MNLMNIAKDVLLQYGIRSASIALLRHNENAVWKVKIPDGGCYILRLHIPAEGLAVTHQLDWLESEMTFIHELDEHSDIRVQHPILSKDDRYAVGLSQNEGFATLLSWLPGTTFDQSDPSAAHYAFLVGELAAKMHEYVHMWPDSMNLPRPAYDEQRVMDAAGAIKHGVAMGLFSDAMYDEIYEGALCICGKMREENAREGWHGLIHSDLGLGNIIVHEGVVSPIDFGLCGHGPFLFDLGGLMGTFDHAHLRKAAIDGYSKHRSIGENDFRSIEAFFVAGIYFFMAMHLENKNVHEWFGRRLPLVISDYVRPLVRGVPFLHELV